MICLNFVSLSRIDSGRFELRICHRNLVAIHGLEDQCRDAACGVTVNEGLVVHSVTRIIWSCVEFVDLIELFWEGSVGPDLELEFAW